MEVEAAAWSLFGPISDSSFRITEVASIDFSPEPSSILQRKEKGDQGKAGHVWGEQHHSDTVGERVQISLVQRLHQKAS